MTKPDALERLRERFNADVTHVEHQGAMCDAILRCAEVLKEAARDKRLNSCCVTTLLYMNRALRSVVEAKNEEECDCPIHGKLGSSECPRC